MVTASTTRTVAGGVELRLEESSCKLTWEMSIINSSGPSQLLSSSSHLAASSLPKKRQVILPSNTIKKTAIQERRVTRGSS
ncbi:hypothetical protein Y1Q_0019309 [Alligator mississippiensis]|uniref:Uncharacterized protein n=1 Tax=Alligator mississippiensis TaxID=8496 RepID=A0A151MQX3_ALLMI|nr:hypothetical protein Y1Q_0019309 [Alligator mississippiensis]